MLNKHFLAGLALMLPTPVLAAEAVLNIDGVRSDAGTVRIAAYANAEDFLKPGKHAHAVSVPAEVGRMTVTIEGLAEGDYAFVIHHDENDNRELETNVLGMPTEGVGFSRDARATFGPPDFSDAAVRVSEGSVPAQATMAY